MAENERDQNGGFFLGAVFTAIIALFFLFFTGRRGFGVGAYGGGQGTGLGSIGVGTGAGGIGGVGAGGGGGTGSQRYGTTGCCCAPGPPAPVAPPNLVVSGGGFKYAGGFSESAPINPGIPLAVGGVTVQ